MVGSARFFTPYPVGLKHTDYSSSSTWAFTLPVAPTNGNLMILLVGGIQSRTVTFPVGWTQASLNPSNGSQTHIIAWKTAGPSESTGFNVIISASMQGAIEYIELSDTDPISSMVIGSSVLQPTGSYSSAISGVITYSRPMFVISTALWNDTMQFTTNNSFRILAGIGRMQSAWRAFNRSLSSFSVTWSKVTGVNATSTKVNNIIIYGRQA